MFEQEYKRANDRIHPRKDLLKEMEAQWAKEAAQPPEETEKVTAFPSWVRYAGMAAGILLCVGLGMGSVLLFTRNRSRQNISAHAEAPMMMDMAEAEEEAKILTEPAVVTEANDAVAGGMLLEARKAESADEPIQGMHPATDEAEVEDAIRYGTLDRVYAEASLPKAVAEPTAEDSVQPNQTKAADAGAKAAAATVKTQYGTGKLLLKEDLLTVFQPVMEQVQVVRYADKKLTKVFPLKLMERGAQVKDFFWMDSEFLAVREKNGDTELMRFGVADWKAPRHLMSLTQSGTFLAAGAIDGRLVILSSYRATEEEPLPWAGGERIDYSHVLLDGERPGDTFTVLTVYDPNGDEFAYQTALLAESRGVAFGQDGLLLWTGTEETVLYAFSCGEKDLALTAEATRQGAVLSALAVDEGFRVLMRTGEDALLLTLDSGLNEKAHASAAGAGSVSRAQMYEDGAVFLTVDALHVLTETGDRTLAISADGFHRLAADRLLTISASGRLQLISLGQDALKVLDAVEMRDSVSLLLDDPSRMAYDPEEGRLLIPAGQKVYQYMIDGAGRFNPRGAPLVFPDHTETEQLELRCLLTEDRVFVFYKDGIVLCNLNLGRVLACKY